MLAATNGALWLLSTPQGPRGFFYDEWVAKQSSTRTWLKISASAESSGRVTESFLNGERKRKTAEQFTNEFECAFASPHRNVFEEEWLERSFSAEVPMFDECSRADLRYAQHRPMCYLAVDLAKVRDHAALVLLEYRVIPTGKRDAATYPHLYRRELRVVLVERFRIGTDYHDLVARLSRLCHHPHLVGHTQLIIEKNGPGQVVDEMIKRAKLPVSYLPVTTTGGNQVSVRGSDRFVPKEKLIGTLEYLFQQNLLKISSQIQQSDLLREELRQFERRSQRGGASKLGAGTGHDDMVMALALAGWWAYENKSRALSGPELKALDY